ncbi:hypothetical protein RMS29_027405 (plasmid) [Agrobacterium rosae]|uniref:Uncharacterized protein n=1 Tax=Agrobacterium rosae TaxID=1972867 RepID=A0AAW9FNX0_9HYPH|nr:MULTISPECIES: hypothetical protein [Agrobacterium]MCF1501592.1 hypothetical protein [Allorhizobium sp. Av2]MDX8321682.1 hypothetical protein [Agrobacterium sp. rho-8.1]MDX8305144.1 hypothetical protein [Agrobacterium rosae]MDX8311427.1 hypothetical protein [Agrobacterium sp. rho-13.3]MDX8316340.1 hypothetical protein [Agrobacterium rosae]
MADKYDEYEASAKLDLIADKLKEIDRLLQAAYPHFDQHVMELINKADPNNDMDPHHWANKMKLIAETILTERLDKDDAAFSTKSTSSYAEPDNDGPNI